MFGRCACSRVFMHDCAVLVLAKGLRKLRMPVEIETWEPSFPPPRAANAEASDDEDGPDARLDLRIEELLDATVVVDYSLVGATNLYAPATAKTLFASAQRGKHARYREFDAATGRRFTNLKLRPFIQSTFGSLGPEACALLRDVRKEAGVSTRALEDRLAVFLARAVARRLRRAYGVCSIAPPEASSWWPDLPQSGPGRAPDEPDERSTPSTPRATSAAPRSAAGRSSSKVTSHAEEGVRERSEVSKETGGTPPDRTGSRTRESSGSHGKEPRGGKSSRGKELKSGNRPVGKVPEYANRSQGNGQPGPKVARHAGNGRGPRGSRPEFGKPGGIYGPDGARLPAPVFYRANKERYQVRVRRVDGKHHRDLATAIAEASVLCVEPA